VLNVLPPPFDTFCERVIVPAVPAWFRIYTRPWHAQDAALGSVHDMLVFAV
jgi:hypothetical protein